MTIKIPKTTKIPKINIISIAYILSVFLLLLSYVDGFPLNNYMDDLIAVIFLLFIIIGLAKKTFNKRHIIELCTVLFVCVLGIFSNYYFEIVTDFRLILSDLFSFIKIFLIYYGTIGVLYKNDIEREKIIKYLSFISKIFVVFAFIFGVLNFFNIVKMYSTIRMGMRNYYFYFHNASQFGVFTGCLLAFIIFENKDNLIYKLMAFACLFMSFKGMSLIILSVYLLLTFIVNRKIKMWHLVIIAVALAFVLRFQLKYYIFDSESPRSILLKYGFVTANDCFPFGAGFATYGSNEAAINYSPLYYKYGFNNRKALTFFVNEFGKITTYLNDTYIGMVLGQFGFIGCFLICAVIISIGYLILNSKPINRNSKNIALACFACFCGMTVMAGSIKAQPGEILMMVFALFNCGQNLLTNNR